MHTPNPSSNSLISPENSPFLVTTTAQYPFPIAYACQKLLEEKEPTARLKAALAIYENVVVYVDLLLLSLYYRKEIPAKTSYSEAASWLEIPDFAYWTRFLKEILEGGEGENPLLRQLYAWYGKVEKESNIYLEEINNYQKKGRNIGHLTALGTIRGTLIKLFPSMVEEEYQAYYASCHTSLEKILRELKFLESFPLYYIESISPHKQEVTAKKMMGAETNFGKVVLKSSPKLLPNQVNIHDSAQDTFYPLHPFILYQECYYCIREERATPWEVFLFQGRGAKRLFYSGIIHKTALRDPIPAYLEVKEIQTKPALTELKSVKELWEIAFQITEASLAELKSDKILQSYYPRKEAEAVLESFIEKPRYSLFILSGSKGVGKTTLLAQMAKRWASQGEVVFLLRIVGKRGADLAEEMAFLLGGKEFWTQARKIAETSQQKWIIILDGVENTSNPNDFFAGLAKFARECKNVKILISLPEMYYCLWTKYIPKELVMPVDGSCLLLESAQPYFRLTNCSQAELKDLYCTLASDVESAAPSFSTIPKKIRGMLRNPSLTRIFLMCFQNREVPRYMGVRELLEGLVVNQLHCSKWRREFLEHFIESLQKSSQLSLTLDQLIDNDDPVLLKECLNARVPSGVLELIDEGILEQQAFPYPDGNVISFLFPMSFLQDYLHYRTMALAGKHGDDLLDKYLLKVLEGNPNLWGVVFFALFRLLDKQYFERFVEILKKTDSSHPLISLLIYEILVLKEESTSCPFSQEGPITALIELLLNANSSSVLTGLVKFALYLYHEEKFKAAASLLDKVIQQNLEADFPYDPLIVTLVAAYCYHRAQESNQASKLYKKCAKMLKKLESSERDAEVDLFLGTIHHELGELEKAETFFQKCMANIKDIQGTMQEAALYEEFGKLAEERKEYEKASEYFHKQKNVVEQSGQELHLGKVLENMARIAEVTGKKTEAVALLQNALTVFRETGARKKLALCQYRLGKLLMGMGEIQQTFTYLVQCVDVLEALEEKELLSDTYLSLGHVCEQLKKFHEGRGYFQKALDILTELNNETGISRCYEEFGLLELGHDKTDKAQEYFKKALAIYERQSNQPGVGNIKYLMGVLYQKRNELVEAEKYYQESLKIRRNLNNLRGMGEIYNNIAVVLAQRGELQAASQELQKSIEIYQKIDDKKGLAEIKQTEALIYHLQGDNTKALECYLECGRLYEELKELKELGAIYNRIGLIHKQRGNFYDALAFFEKGAKIQEAIGDLVGLSASYNNLGLIYDAKNEYEKALTYYQKDLQITEKLGDKRGLATSYNNIAILHYNHRHYARALWYLEKCSPLYEELGEKEMCQKTKERIQYIKEKI